MREPTPDDVRGLWVYLGARFGARVHEKSSVDAWELVGDLLGETGVVDPAAFMERFATTLGRDVFVPYELGVVSGAWSLWRQVVNAVHEHQHVEQYRRNPTGFLFDYSTSSAARAHLEADAYACHLELHWLRFGRIPARAPRALAELLRDYACSEEDIDVAEAELVAVARSAMRGKITRAATLEAERWIDEHAPGVLRGRVAA